MNGFGGNKEQDLLFESALLNPQAAAGLHLILPAEALRLRKDAHSIPSILY